MGRITPNRIQRVGRELMEKYPSKFNAKFEDNKKAVDVTTVTQTKKVRNLLAGYITRKIKNKKEIRLTSE